LKFVLHFLSLMMILLMVSSTAYSMNTVKGWINQVRPGTFETTDASGDAEQNAIKQFSESEQKVLTALAAREKALKEKEALHQQRAADLKRLSQQIEQKLDTIRKLTKDFEDKRLVRQEMDEKDIKRMVTYYETMDPDKIAVFFNQMDRETAVQIIMRMNPRKASGVLELLDPAVAVDITERVTRFKKDRQLTSSN
jgi:flagellar motility protein MotE (MotC chaperone)